MTTPTLPRAVEIARRIEDDVVASGWRVGELIGSEAELMHRFEVGRSTVREAFRILQSRHVATPRRGPGGGLMVTAPQLSTVLEHASLYLEWAGFAAVDLYEAMAVLERTAVERLIATLDESGAARLRELLAAEGDDLAPVGGIHTEIARLAQNPVLELCMHIISSLARSHGTMPSTSERRWLQACNTELVEAIITGDILAADRAVQRRLVGLNRRQAIGSRRNQAPESTDGDR